MCNRDIGSSATRGATAAGDPIEKNAYFFQTQPTENNEVLLQRQSESGRERSKTIGPEDGSF